MVERANHSFDPFPDEGRILPFGSGAAIFYNFIDLVLHNPTADTFRCASISPPTNWKANCCAARRALCATTSERAQRFVRDGDAVLRLNEIWRDIRERARPAPCWPASACTATGCA